MNSRDINEKDKYEPLNKEIFNHIKFITEETKADYDKFVHDLKNSDMFHEFEELVEKYNRSENKENLEIKFKAFGFLDEPLQKQDIVSHKRPSYCVDNIIKQIYIE